MPRRYGCYANNKSIHAFLSDYFAKIKLTPLENCAKIHKRASSTTLEFENIGKEEKALCIAL